MKKVLLCLTIFVLLIMVTGCKNTEEPNGCSIDEPTCEV